MSANALKPATGIVAAGHEETARAAATILDAGGNAFDAGIAAMLAACAAEPVLASFGGGGFMLAQPANQPPVVYDFFVQTPISKKDTSSVDFYPIHADFGTAHQEFHIGWGSVATPGFAKGLFRIYDEHATMPMERLAEPALMLTRKGIPVNAFQHQIASIVSPILFADPHPAAIYRSATNHDHVIQPGEIQHITGLDDLIESMTREGEALFYTGEFAQQISSHAEEYGGHLSLADLQQYQVVKRAPLITHYRNREFITNPPPSVGGMLITFALKLLARCRIESSNPKDEHYVEQLARVMALTQDARSTHADALDTILHESTQAAYHGQLNNPLISSKGTTQISIADHLGNLVSITLSNGEGCGSMLPGTGTMPNNMLGESDLNPQGFHRWPVNTRIASMMSPSLLRNPNGDAIVLGSGGSNRIRSAILQVINLLVDFEFELEPAVLHPRIHYEDGLLSIEPGFDPQVFENMRNSYPRQQHWPEQNLFFGGVHAVSMTSNGQLTGVGDPRRGGVCLYATNT